jgi:2-dehydro-3-deoxygalactonokinase
MIGIDWGTTSFRAFRLGANGEIRDRRASARGVMTVRDGRFGDTLREEIGPWLAAGEDRVLLCGMVGSRQGWLEAPYLPLPAGLDSIAAALTEVPFDWARVRLIPGLIGADRDDVPEVMRGEETQLLGLDQADALVCLPGTHSKWARLRGGLITGFTTHMTGEMFAALRGHTILGRMMRDGPPAPAAFAQGVARSADAGGLTHHVFGVRTLALTGVLAETETAAYLSGLLIGHEVRAALAEHDDAAVTVIGGDELAALYAQAITALGRRPRISAETLAAAGIARIGARAGWGLG